MSDDEIHALLGDGGTGVLSFSTTEDNPPHSLPVSFGFDQQSENLHFRLSMTLGSTKAKLTDKPVSFVTHKRTEEGWRSVVATGSLEDVTDLPAESIAIQERWAVDIPFVDIFDEAPDDVDFRAFRLVPDRLTGRKAVTSSE